MSESGINKGTSFLREPTDGVEVVWLILSLLSLDVDQQLYLVGDLPLKAMATNNDLINSNATLLLSAFFEHYAGWWDEFQPCPVIEAMVELVSRMSWMASSREDFLRSCDWCDLRRLARDALLEAGVPPWPLIDPVNFSDYVEVR